MSSAGDWKSFKILQQAYSEISICCWIETSHPLSLSISMKSMYQITGDKLTAMMLNANLKYLIFCYHFLVFSFVTVLSGPHHTRLQPAVRCTPWPSRVMNILKSWSTGKVGWLSSSVSTPTSDLLIHSVLPLGIHMPTCPWRGFCISPVLNRCTATAKW